MDRVSLILTISRIVYAVIGIAALWCISLLFTERKRIEE